MVRPCEGGLTVLLQVGVGGTEVGALECDSVATEDPPRRSPMFRFTPAGTRRRIRKIRSVN